MLSDEFLSTAELNKKFGWKSSKNDQEPRNRYNLKIYSVGNVFVFIHFQRFLIIKKILYRSLHKHLNMNSRAKKFYQINLFFRVLRVWLHHILKFSNNTKMEILGIMNFSMFMLYNQENGRAEYQVNQSKLIN